MGCWNKTCGLSNLHIWPGEAVYVFPMIQNSFHDRCYSTGLWSPSLVPFISHYDDYGAGENSSGIGLEILLTYLKEHIVDKEVGENQYHDIEVKKDKINEDLFFQSIHEGRLFIFNHLKNEVPVDYVMVKKSFVDKILQNQKVSMYKGPDLGNSGYKNSYIEFSHNDLVNNIPSFIEFCQKANKELISLRFYSHIMTEHIAAYALRLLSENFNLFLGRDAFDLFHDLIENNKLEEAGDLLEHASIGLFVESFVNSVRKTWHPSTHEGSQQTKLDGYKLFTKVLNELINEEEKEQEDLNSEEIDEEVESE